MEDRLVKETAASIARRPDRNQENLHLTEPLMRYRVDPLPQEAGNGVVGAVKLKLKCRRRARLRSWV